MRGEKDVSATLLCGDYTTRTFTIDNVKISGEAIGLFKPVHSLYSYEKQLQNMKNGYKT